MNQERQIHNLALIGFMGTGKSTVGRLVARDLYFTFLDTDDVIETRTGQFISEIFSKQGEAAFREIERGVVRELAERTQTVIATGGGLASDEQNLASLKAHAYVVCLWAAPDRIFERVRHQTHRPLLNDPDPLERIRELLALREPFYKQADALINTEMRSAREVAAQVLHQFTLSKDPALPESP